MPRSLNDSGCPLGDTDLFDTGLNDEEEEEEESLDAIRAAVKQKMKKQEVKINIRVSRLLGLHDEALLKGSVSLGTPSK